MSRGSLSLNCLRHVLPQCPPHSPSSPPLPTPFPCLAHPAYPALAVSPSPPAGKTLLARAVAHHTDCTFIRVSGGELVQKYIGEGSRMVRELFVMAR